MRNLLLALALIAAPLSATATVCTHVPFKQKIEAAPIIFIATITSASSSGPFSQTRDGSTYRVTYSFEVRESLKGDATSITSLYTNNTYTAYDSRITWDSPDTRLLPGDNVLVLAHEPGDVQVGACTDSRLWDPTPEQLNTLRMLTAAPSNNAFKPELHRYARHMAETACHVPSYALQFGLT